MTANIKKSAYAVGLQNIMTELYASGPPMIKICSSIDQAYSEIDYAYLAIKPTDKVLAVTSSLSYSFDPSDLRVTFLEIADCFGIDVGIGSMVEVWDNQGDTLYFRFRSAIDQQINGNADLVRMPTIVMASAINYNVTSPSNVNTVFPIEYKLYFPEYLRRSDYHTVIEQYFGLKDGTDKELGSQKIYQWGGTQSVTGNSQGFRSLLSDFPVFGSTLGYPNKDYMEYKFEWTDDITALLTVNFVRGNPYATKFYFYLLSKFYNGFDGYPNPAPLANSISPSIYGPRDMVIERKKFGETSFTPITVTRTAPNESGTDGVSLDFGGRYNTIECNWEWDIL